MAPNEDTPPPNGSRVCMGIVGIASPMGKWDIYLTGGGRGARMGECPIGSGRQLSYSFELGARTRRRGAPFDVLDIRFWEDMRRITLAVQR